MFKTAVLLLILMLAACSSSIRMSDEDRQTVQTININKKIILPDEMFYAPPTGAIIFGVIGAAISIEANRGPGQILASFARDNGVKIEEIVGKAFIRKMQDLPGIRLHQKQYDAQLNIKIEAYGLSSKFGSMSEVKPVLKVGAQLVTKHNKVLWQNNDYVTEFSDLTPSLTVESLTTNPDGLKKAWEAVADVVVTNILNTM